VYETIVAFLFHLAITIVAPLSGGPNRDCEPYGGPLVRADWRNVQPWPANGRSTETSSTATLAVEDKGSEEGSQARIYASAYPGTCDADFQPVHSSQSATSTRIPRKDTLKIPPQPMKRTRITRPIIRHVRTLYILAAKTTAGAFNLVGLKLFCHKNVGTKGRINLESPGAEFRS
jgi:hypothetical protein